MNHEHNEENEYCQECYQKGFEEGKEFMQRQIEHLLKYTIHD